VKSFYSKRVIKLLLYDKQRGKCNGCKEPLPIPKMELDHIIPRAGGGSDVPSNFQLLCKPCNIKKRALIKSGSQYNLFDRPKEPLRGERVSIAPVKSNRQMTEAEKKRAQRERARAAGLCIVCRREPARHGMSTCQKCSDAAKRRMRIRRGLEPAKKRRKRKKH
jgi:hypothetical protein